MPLVINALGVDTQTDTHTHKHACQCANQSNFKTPGAHWPAAGLTTGDHTSAVQNEFMMWICLIYSYEVEHSINIFP